MDASFRAALQEPVVVGQTNWGWKFWFDLIGLEAQGDTPWLARPR